MSSADDTRARLARQLGDLLAGSGKPGSLVLEDVLVAGGIPRRYASPISRASRAAVSDAEVDAIVGEWADAIAADRHRHDGAKPADLAQLTPGVDGLSPADLARSVPRY